MAMGMSPEEFWTADPNLAVAYRKAWEIRKEQLNEQLWLQGMYIKDSLTALAHNLTRKRGQKTVSYPKQPYEIAPQTENRKIEKRKQAQKEAIEYFNGLKKRLEQKYAR